MTYIENKNETMRHMTIYACIVNEYINIYLMNKNQKLVSLLLFIFVSWNEKKRKQQNNISINIWLLINLMQNL